MVQIQEEEDTYEQHHHHQHQQHAQQQSSSSNNNNNNNNNNNSPHDSRPSSASSISSDHTFHGFSPPKSPSLSPHSFHPLPLPAPAPTPAPAPAPVARLVHDQPEVVTKTQPDADTGLSLGHRGTRERKPRSPPGTVLSQARTHKVVKRVGLVLRFLELVVCLISFCVMASDKRRGWALDSFDRYIEFRYSMTVNVIGFAYAVLQGLDLLLQLTTGKDLAGSKLRYCFDFAIDQILAYLLLSSSSSAFTRVDDWISNWGPDKFPAMASASVGVSFVAFIAFAFNSLVSGYTLCTHGHT